MFTTRILEPTDSDIYQALRLEALVDSPQAFNPTREEQLAAPPVALENGPRGFVLGAFNEQPKLVGIAGLLRDPREKKRHKAMVWGFYVAPEARRFGVGRLLLERLIEEARALKLRRLTLSVVTSQKPAAHLYESCGFVPFGVEPDSLRIADQFLDEQHMSLRLNYE